MNGPTEGGAAATLLGDVVGSREHADQRGLLEGLGRLLARVADEVVALQPPAVTIGDEFQGVYRTVGAAIEAAYRCRLHVDDEDLGLPDGTDLRFGIGWGEVLVSRTADPPFGQSGSGWWSAREALDAVAARPDRAGWPRTSRLSFRRGDGGPTAAVDGLLLGLDELVGRMDQRDRRILLALLDGRRQGAVAAELGISQPAVAKRVHADGISVVVRALELVADEETRGVAVGG